ncbi:MAG: D-cysteine desulfhydrase family protein [Asgard group archaeon]|nr:D-cysteine desulfhydrase family protein [Asgard group archaeon]
MLDFNIEKIPRVKICTLPTPIQFMPNLSEHLQGVNVYVKRDDLTGIALGGNKNRKVEYLLGDALSKDSDTIITEGTLTSNHCLQAAAGAFKLGMDCHVVLSDAPIGEKIPINLLFKMVLEVKIHRVKNHSERKSMMDKIAAMVKEEGKKPYVIPSGGSDKIGIFGYINFFKEIAQQSEDMGIAFDYFIHGTGSAGTQAGSIVGKKLFYPAVEVIGINAGYKKEKIITNIKKIIEGFESDNSINLAISDSDIIVLDDFIGEGYEILSEEVINTVKLIAKLEGIFLDPVYNSKAMIGLIGLVKKNYFPKNSNVLFLHSGGNQAFYHFIDDLLEKI